jgi:hypothetical protein
VKFFLLVALLFTNIMTLKSQKKISFGMAAGINLSNLSYDFPPKMPTQSKPGFNAYGFMDLPLSKAFSVQTEIGYYGLGCNWGPKDYPSDVPVLHGTININYLSFAILPKYEISHTGVSIFAGAAMGIKLNSSNNSDFYNGPPGPAVNYIAVNPHFNTKDVFLVGGIGYDFYRGMGISARYMQGLTNIVDQNDLYSPQPSIIHNRAFCFSLSWRF